MDADEQPREEAGPEPAAPPPASLDAPPDAAPAGPPPAPLALSRLKEMTIQQLTAAAVESGMEDAPGLKKHDLIFRMLQAQAERNGLLFAEGVLETMPDGYGFLRAPESSYLPGPDDIYVSPSQIRRFNLHTGDTVSGQVRPPRHGRALLRPDQGRGDQLRPARGRGATRSSSTT